MADDRVTPLPKRGDVSLSFIKFAIYIGTLIVGGVVFVFISQASQDGRIADACAQVKTVEARHVDHTRQVYDTFSKLDRTLTNQQDLLTKTRESMLRLEGSHERLVDEVKHFSAEVRRKNP